MHIRTALCVLAALVASPAGARSTGIFNVDPNAGCNACHGGGNAPTVVVLPPSSPVAASATVPLTVRISATNKSASGTGFGGFNLVASAGTLSAPMGSGAQVSGSEATHTSPKAESAGFIEFTVNWTAPATPAAVTFSAWGNSVNLNGNNQGDRAAKATLSCGVGYQDADGDGTGGASAFVICGAPPAGFSSTTGDCDDADAAVFPGATETCNGVDDDCDGTIDESGGSSLFVDADGDGFGNPAAPSAACTPSMGIVADSSDCDDTNAAINPGQSEVCNNADDDCDQQVDEGLPLQTFFVDADGDGVGGTTTVQACMLPANASTITGDCDDSDATVKPGIVESCNLRDDDCDGDTDEGVQTTFFRDADGDGFGAAGDTTEACGLPAGYAANDQDCDDARGDVNPSGSESCDGVDEDCDSLIDDGVPNSTCGLGICQRTGTSCSPATCSPGLSDVEVCNGLDDDCNGTVDDDAPGLCPGAEVCTPDGAGGAVCALPPEDAGMQLPEDAGVDGGVDAGVAGADAGSGGGGGNEDPPGGCGCGSAGGSALALMTLVALAGALRGRRRRTA